MPKKERLDILLVEKGLVPSREKGKRIIMAGEVFVDNQKVDKAGTMVKKDSQIEIRGKDHHYVSRAAFKLLEAIKEFKLNLKDKVVADIGSSTGGFTQVCLENKAKKVYAIDTGTNQLAYNLRIDSRVVVMEKTNARYIEELPDKIDFVCMDVSFISIIKIIDTIKKITTPKAEMVLLIKPQFEGTKREIDECKGVITDSALREAIKDRVLVALLKT